MLTFDCWVRLNQYQTANIRIQANTGWEAKMLAENMYGHGSVLNYTQVNE